METSCRSSYIFASFRIFSFRAWLSNGRESRVGITIAAWLFTGLEWVPWLRTSLLTRCPSMLILGHRDWFELSSWRRRKHVNRTRLRKIAGLVKGYYNVLDSKWCTKRLVNFSEEITRENSVHASENVEIETKSTSERFILCPENRKVQKNSW